MTFHLQDVERNVVGEQAAKWLTQLTDGDSGERDAFVSWLKQSPRHIEEFLLVSATWQAFSRAPDACATEHSDEIDRIVEAARAATTTNIVALQKQSTAHLRDAGESHGNLIVKGIAASRTRRRRWMAAGVAAGLALLAFGLVGTRPLQLLLSPDSVQTSVGEQRTVRLADGSIVYLNARSRMRVDFSRDARNIELDEGEAVFKVAHDTARPFRVHAGDAIVRAVGTQFNVYRRSRDTTVSVLEGKVEVRSAESASATTEASSTQKPGATGGTPNAVGTAVLIAAGEQASITPQAIVRQAQPDVIAAVAWRERRLVFRAARLEDIAVEFGRYSPRRLQLQDAVARDMRITGTFDADDPGSLVLFLEKLDELHVGRNGEEFVIRGR